MKHRASFYRAFMLLAAVFLAIIGAGCASRQSGSDSAAGTSSEGFDARTDSYEVPEKKAEAEQRTKASDGGDRKTSGSQAGQTKTSKAPKSVFRVQLYASQYYSEAVRERDVARDVFNEPVFLMYESPYYKVSVGNCVQRKDGESLLNRARTLGYRDSWLTESEPDSLYFNSPGASGSAESRGTSKPDGKNPSDH